MMNLSLLVGSAAVLGSVLALWWAVTGARPARAGVDLSDVRRPVDFDLRAATLRRDVGERTLEPLVARLAGLARRYTPRGRVTGLEQRLLVAGAPGSWTLERILAVKALFALAGGALALLRLLAAPSLVGVLLALGIGAFGFFLPDILLGIKTDKRQQVIRRALADTVDQLTIAVQAGLGLDAAIARVAVTGDGPLAGEFARVSQDVRAGMRRGDALLAMSERVQLPELRQLVVALAQAEKLGVPVAQTMKVQAAELRLKRRQHAEEQAMKLPVKILFPMMFCIMPCLFIVILGPAALSIFQTLSST
ncbi:MAG TPA: type II secretion system F family protein [Acidimicrobiales bacterium]|jgi:tight adherence protein C|nr:type II secretion system F family protein [Acidimicrobiales bacterium]